MPESPAWPWVQLAVWIWPHHLATLGLSCFIYKTELLKTTLPALGQSNNLQAALGSNLPLLLPP